MAASRLSTKQYSTLLDRSPRATSASASPTGDSGTATVSPSKSAAKRVSELENQLLFQIRAHQLPEPVCEFRFHQTRRWRADFAWPERLLMVEVEGGVFSNGRHVRGKGFEADCEKYSEAALDGWRVIRCTGTHIKSGEAVEWIRRALA